MADRSDSRARRCAAAILLLLAGACTRASEPATAPATPVVTAEPAAPANEAPASEAPPAPAPAEVPVEAKAEPAAARQQRACKDGEAPADGCRCDGETCMDICCVGSACTHHATPDGGWAKCMKMPRR